MKHKTIPHVFAQTLATAHPRHLFDDERKERLRVFMYGLSDEKRAHFALEFVQDRAEVIGYPSDGAKQRVLRILGFCPSGPAEYKDLAQEFGVSRAAIRCVVYRVIRRYVRAIRYRHFISVLTPWFEQEGLCFISAYPTEEEYMAADVGVLRLSTRALTVLERAGIKTIKELRSFSLKKLLLVRTCGEVVLQEVVDEMCRVGFPFKIQEGELPSLLVRKLSL